ncbi:hypothetical protein EV121DRAFT_292840 [Schizophyllum commune]
MRITCPSRRATKCPQTTGSGDVRTLTILGLPCESPANPSAFVAPPRKSSLTHQPPSLPPVQHHAVPLPVERSDCEAEEALRHEEERQRHLQVEREVERRRDQEEDATRKAFLEFKIKRATSERRWHK